MNVLVSSFHFFYLAGEQLALLFPSWSNLTTVIPSLMHTIHFYRNKELKVILVCPLNLNEPFSMSITALAPQPTHHHGQNTGKVRGLQRVECPYKATVRASEATSNRDTNGHQPQCAFLRDVNV